MPPIYLYEIEQGTEPWFACRLGKPGGSSFSDIVLQSGKPATGRGKLLYKLAAEILSGERTETYRNAAMARGTELEPLARSAYELITGADVVQVGYVFADENRRWGCSPDGLVGDDGLVEIKCPLAHTHVEYLDRGNLPGTYYHQCQGQLAVTGRTWLDFMSYSPNIRPFIIRVARDEEFIAVLIQEVERFCDDLELLVEKLR